MRSASDLPRIEICGTEGALSVPAPIALGDERWATRTREITRGKT
ncbi:MAG: hypothetical protein Q7T82_06255 [Armatimonadota bacterium]|nr:hypothetical protein [Armatimonadota bacterium]